MSQLLAPRWRPLFGLRILPRTGGLQHTVSSPLRAPRRFYSGTVDTGHDTTTKPLEEEQQQQPQPEPQERAQEQQHRTPNSYPEPTPEPPFPLPPPPLPTLPDRGIIVFSGIQPTGVPHLGNYFGALRQWRQIQDRASAGTKLLYSVVDLHAITVPQDSEALRTRRRQTMAALLAMGLSEDKCSLFYQSSVSMHSELMWILSCTASMGYLGRMTQWKSKLAPFEGAELSGKFIHENLKLGLFSYPVLMAADILVHGATHVPVGDDQKQHLEFTRECATNFNARYGPVLVHPETITAPASRIMSLRDPLQKMSKSHSSERSRVLLTAEPEEIRARFKGAETDNFNCVTWEPEERPGVSNLLEILSQCASAPTEEPAALAADFQGMGLGVLKAKVADAVIEELSGFREKYCEVLGKKGGMMLDEIERKGAEEARANAREVMEGIKKAVGLLD